MSRRVITLILVIALGMIRAWGTVATPLVDVYISVVDAEDSTPLAMASVEVPAEGIRVFSDKEGKVLLRLQRDRHYLLLVTHVGMRSERREIFAKPNLSMTIPLHMSTLALRGVEVVAQSSPTMAGKSVIHREALEYLQPVSLADALSLLPGGLVRIPTLRGVQQVSMRETRGSESTALGTAILLDGVPLSNDANLLGMGDTGQRLSGYTTMNGGQDLRTLSVDHVEAIEVEQGIPSVRYGNLTSGLISLRTRIGNTPWSIRMQADPYTKLFSVGKGLEPAANQSLYLGTDITRNMGSLINPIDSYTRLSGVLRYRYIGRDPHHFRANLTYHALVGVDSRKFDPETMTSQETFSKHSDTHMLSWDLHLDPSPQSWRSLEWQSAVNLSSDIVRQARWILPRNSLVQPMAMESGDYEGAYLPAEYFCEYETESLPFNAFSQLRSSHMWSHETDRGRRWDINLLWGAEWNYNKNRGRGPLYDPKLPPNPGNALSSRPVAYRDIPGSSVVSLFAESQVRFPGVLGFSPSVRLGVRGSYDLNLWGSRYEISRDLAPEPRVSGTLAFPEMFVAGHPLRMALRGGWGMLVKRPTLAYLYPNRLYSDFIQINYYVNNPAHRLLWVRTYVRDRENYALAQAYESKWEGSLQANYRGVSLTLNLFRHSLTSGYEYRAEPFYSPYIRYTYKGNAEKGSKPTLDDFSAEEVDRTSTLTRPDNSVKVIKEGLEYVLSLPRIPLLETRFQIQGALYSTLYGNSLPTEYRPISVVGGKTYPYIGYYTNRDDRETYRLHTLVRSDTHLPRLALIFTSQLQLIWSDWYRNARYDAGPNYWYDEKGVRHEEVDLNDPLQSQLVSELPDYMFEKTIMPLSVTWHLKMTKEIGRHVKVSLFVNNLATYDPVYQSNLKTQHQEWKKPFFGSELRINL